MNIATILALNSNLIGTYTKAYVETKLVMAVDTPAADEIS